MTCELWRGEGEYMSKGDALNLEQALAASRHHLACRRVGDRRVIVDGREQLLTVHLQHRSGKHWMADDNGGACVT